MMISNCCGAPFYEPGYPDNDICSSCREHADAVDDEEVLEESEEANQRATNKVSIETTKEIVHRIMGENNNG